MPPLIEDHFWLSVLAVISGFFLVPLTMLYHDRCRERRLRDRHSGG